MNLPDARELRVNVGCGDHYAPGWLNVDVAKTDQVQADVVGRLGDSLADQIGLNVVSHLYLGHILEHIDLSQMESAMADIHRMMSPDGIIMVVGPDFARATEWVRAGDMTRTAAGEVLLGGSRWDGDDHRWVSTAETTRCLLEFFGFLTRPVEIENVPGIWPLVSRIGWQFAIEAEIHRWL